MEYIIGLRKYLIILLFGVLMGSGQVAVAKPVFKITADVSTIHMNPGETTKNIVFTVVNVSGVSLPNVRPASAHYQGSFYTASIASSTCSGKSLANNAKCQMVFNIIATTVGSGKLEPVVCAEGAICSHGEVNMVSDTAAQTIPELAITTDLPANIAAGVPYPIVVGVTNPSAQYPLTGISIARSIPNVTVTEDTCGTTLAPNATCALSGVFQTSDIGAYNLTSILSYNGGSPITLTATVGVTRVAVSGQVVVPLPAQIPLSGHHPVVFQYTNYGNQAATGLQITKPTVQQGFTETQDTCGNTLAAGDSCQIEGTFAAPGAGTTTLRSSLAYDEQVQSVELSTQSEASAVSVNGHVDTPLPANLAVGEEYPVYFTYINTSDELPATQLRFIRWLPNTTITTNSCSSVNTLPPNGSCAIAGTYTAQASEQGPIALSTALAYAEHQGPTTPITTHGTITQVAVNGGVIRGLPANIAEGTSYPVTFQYTNHGSAVATAVSVNRSLPNFTVTSDTCSSTLAPGDSCEIIGGYQATGLGPVSLSTTLFYAESSQNVHLTTSSTVTNVVVTGEVTTPLPSIMNISQIVPFRFTFTNHSSLAATNVTVVKHLPDTQNVADTCQTMLAAGDSCTVSGDFFPIYSGHQSLSAVLVYNQGSNVREETNSNTLGEISYYYAFESQYQDGDNLASPIADLPSLRLVGGPPVQQAGPVDEQFRALKLNGTNQRYAEVMNNKLIGGTTTFDFWVKWNSFAQSWSRVFDFSNGQATDNILVAHVGTSDQFQFEIYKNHTPFIQLRLSNFWSIGQWIHVVINVDGGGKVRIYRNNQYIDLNNPPDGIRVLRNVQGGAIPNISRSMEYIGRSAWAQDGYADAAIADFRIYNGTG